MIAADNILVFSAGLAHDQRVDKELRSSFSPCPNPSHLTDLCNKVMDSQLTLTSRKLTFAKGQHHKWDSSKDWLPSEAKPLPELNLN